MLLAATCVAAAVAPSGIASAKPKPLTRTLPGQVLAQLARQRADARAAEMAAFPPVLRRIAQCESHNDPRSIGGGGIYRGAFQMTMSSWRGTGGHGDPARASLLEQYRRAAVLLRQSGAGQWPVCGR